MSPNNPEQNTERALLEARVAATNYMREWWSQCAKIEREHRTGIAWLADHVLAAVGLPELLAIRDAAQVACEAEFTSERLEAMRRLRRALSMTEPT